VLDLFLDVLSKEAAAAGPHNTLIQPIPKVVQPDVWQFGVHDHHSEGGAGHHLDLRLGHPASGHAHSWALRHWPEPGETRLAIQQPTHKIAYMDFHGRLTSGYGKGRVDLARRGRTDIISADRGHVRFNVKTADGNEEYLLHRTDDPKKWLLRNVTPTEVKTAGYCAMSEELLKIARAKNASLLAALGIGAAGHAITNLLGRSAHHNSNLAEMLAHKGFQHGAGGAQISPLAKRVTKLLMGPESMVPYDLGRAAGQKIYALDPAKRELLYKNTAAALAQAQQRGALPALEGLPMAGPVLSALQHDVNGTAPKFHSTAAAASFYGRAVGALSSPTSTPFDSIGRKITNNAVAAPFAAATYVEPSLLGHYGVNYARERAAKTQVGQRTIKGWLSKGFSGGTFSPRSELAADVALSPSALDPYRLGKQLHDNLSNM